MIIIITQTREALKIPLKYINSDTQMVTKTKEIAIIAIINSNTDVFMINLLKFLKIHIPRTIA